jgi:hypothetical protein
LFLASVVADDDYKDLALLKIGVGNLDFLPIGESQKVKVLDTIFVLGYPLAPALGADVSASQGQVNALRDTGRIPLLQIDANVNPGNSGGPVLNDRGEVVGIVVAKLNAAFFLKEIGSIPERVNFAIPIDEARGIVRQAYPLDFVPSAKTERFTSQQIFEGARKATVLITSQSGTSVKTSASPAPPPQAKTQSIFGFVKAFVESGSSGAANNEIDFYGPKVVYYENGTVDRSFIAADLAAYNEKWPIRHYSIIAGPDIAQTPTQGLYSVTCRIEFRVQNSKRGVAGTALRVIGVGQFNDSFLVLGVTETVEKRTPIRGEAIHQVTPSVSAERSESLLPSGNIPNHVILSILRSMPTGGGTGTAIRDLERAVQVRDGKARSRTLAARSTYSAGATYLVFVRALQSLLPSSNMEGTVAEALAIWGQADGVGVWGRWNANGPATACLFRELGLGHNFTSFEVAEPGDFMKIFFSDAVGPREISLSAIYLGREQRNGAEMVRFWTSSKPLGYGEKTITRSRIAHAIFSRLETPANIERSRSLAVRNGYLAGLTTRESTISEALAQSGAE